MGRSVVLYSDITLSQGDHTLPPLPPLLHHWQDVLIGLDTYPRGYRWIARGFALSRYAAKQLRCPAYYFHVDANGTLLVAGGEYMPPPERLRAIRRHVIADAAGFGKLLKNKKLTETFGGLDDEAKLTRPPKGFEADAPHIEYIKMKSFMAWTERSLKKKIPAELATELVAGFKAAYPLVSWLRQVKSD